jgi:transcriptional regulator with XRE-family HTH domain
MVDDHVGTIGERLRSCRRFRGMSLQALADRTGLSKSFLSMVENGQRALDRRSHIDAVVEALDISPSDLTGQPSPFRDGRQAAAHAAVPTLRLTLLDSALDDPMDIPARPLDVLAEEVRRAGTLEKACNYAVLGRILPDLIAELHVRATAGDGAEQAAALPLLVQACQSAFYTLKDLGYSELSWIAAEQARDAALRLDNPVWIGTAEFLRAHALMGAKARQRALRRTTEAADLVQAQGGDGLGAEIYGMLHLAGALAAATLSRPDTAHDHLAEAAEVADHIGESDSEELRSGFGPTNVGIWRLAIAMELGDSEQAVEVGQDIEPARMWRGRRAMFHCDLGRAYAAVPGRERQAVGHLREAERLAPQRIRAYPLARDSIAVMLTRAKATAGGRDLRGLAYRMGLPH